MLPNSRVPSLRILTLAVVVGVLFYAGPTLAAEPLSEALSRFDIAVTKSSRSLFKGQGDQRTVPLLAQLREQINAGQWKDAIARVHWIGYENQTDQVLKIGGEVIAQIEVKAKEAEETEIHAIDAAVTRAGGACLEASGARQLDPVVAELRSLGAYRRQSEQDESPALFAAHRKLASALGYLQVWQDYLALRSAGKEVEAAQKMDGLARRDEWYPVVARSEVLARAVAPVPSPTPAAQTAAVDEALKNILAKLKSLDDLDAIAQELTALGNTQSSSNRIRSVSGQVARLQNARHAVAAREYTAAYNLAIERLADDPDVVEELAALRQQLLIQVLPHYLPQKDLVAPLPQETVSEYLLRNAKAAVTAKDWLLALRTFEALGAISYAHNYWPSWLHADVQTLKALIQGDKEKSAGEFIRAAISYRLAFDTVSDHVPADAIAEKLRALKKAHPEAFAPMVPGPSPVPRSR